MRYPIKVAPYISSKQHVPVSLAFLDENRLIVYYKDTSYFALYTLNKSQVPLSLFLLRSFSCQRSDNNQQQVTYLRVFRLIMIVSMTPKGRLLLSNLLSPFLGFHDSQTALLCLVTVVILLFRANGEKTSYRATCRHNA